MKDNVDADKILNHIKYTKHWLDKADDDYKNKRFGSGGIVLGLARAELTTAWEEAMQLKTQVLRKVPKKARSMANWRSASAVGLMASGFLIAFMLIRFNNPAFLNNELKPGVEPNTVVITEQPVVQEKAPAPEKAEISEEEAVAAAPAEEQPVEAVETEPEAAVPAAQTVTAMRPAVKTPVRRTTAPKPAPKPAVQPAPNPEPAVVETVEPKSAPRPIVINVTPPPAPKPAARQNFDNIELYKTANDAIMD